MTTHGTDTEARNRPAPDVVDRIIATVVVGVVLLSIAVPLHSRLAPVVPGFATDANRGDTEAAAVEPDWLAGARVAAAAPFDDHAVDLATAVLTGSDYGPHRGHTIRFATPTVTMWVEPGFRDNPVQADNLAQAMAWVSEATGVPFVEVDTPGQAQIVVREFHALRGRVHARTGLRGELRQTDVHIGCCRARIAYEELAQAMGAMHDGADQRSFFSNRTQDLPEPLEFDTWILRTLYQLPPGTLEADVRAAFAATAAVGVTP
jgi:hypothetical protein